MLLDFPFSHDIAITVIIKDEAPYIEEWLDYHIAAGVSKFYIYDNESTDNVHMLLAPYIQSGIVEYIYYPGKYRQIEAYNESVRNHKFECRYMGFIDVDEFLLPLKSERLIDILNDIMEINSQVAAMTINCKSFGSSGHKFMPRGKVLENYLHRAPDGYEWTDLPWKWDAHVKIIANPRRISTVISPHHATYYWNCCAVDENGNIVNGMDNFVSETNRIRINHYFTKSWEEWISKQRKGKADVAGLRPLEEFAWRDRNDIYDDLAMRYWETMKAQPPIERQIPKLDIFALLCYFLQEFQAHPEADYYQGTIEQLLCFWDLCAKVRQNKKDFFYAELLEQVLLQACNNALGAQTVIPAQVELILSIWERIGQDSSLVKKYLQGNLKTILQGFIEIFREGGNLGSERYFTELLLKFLGSGVEAF